MSRSFATHHNIDPAPLQHRSATSVDGGNTMYVVSHSGCYWLNQTETFVNAVALYAGNLLQGEVYDFGNGPELFGMSATVLYAFTPNLATSGTLNTTVVVSGGALEGFSFADANTIWLLDGSTVSKRVRVGGVWSVAAGYGTPTVSLPVIASTGDRSIIGRVEAGSPTWIAYVSSAGYVLRYDESQASGTAFATCTACFTYVAMAPVNTIFRGIAFAPLAATPTSSPSVTASPSQSAAPSQSAGASVSSSSSSTAAATPSHTSTATAVSISSTVTPSRTPSASFTPFPAPTGFAAGSIVVYRLGARGAAATPASGIQAPIFLDTFATSGATTTASVSATLPLSTIAFPTTGANLCTGQLSATEGEMTTDTWGANLYVGACRRGAIARNASCRSPPRIASTRLPPPTTFPRPHSYQPATRSPSARRTTTRRRSRAPSPSCRGPRP